MTKNQFLNDLRESLSVLDKRECDDLINEYANHIDMKMQDGLSEEEAIEGFGSFNELVKEILEAYHVNPEYSANKEDDRFVHSVRKVGQFFSNTFDAILDMRRHEIRFLLGRLVMMAVVVFSLIIVLNIFQSTFRNIFTGILDPRAYNFFLNGILSFVFGLAKMMIICYAIYVFISRYILLKRPIYQDRDSNLEMTRNDETSKLAQTISVDQNINQKERIPKQRYDDGSLERGFYFVVKIFMVLFFFIPLASMTLGSVIGTSFLFAFAVLGYPLLGFCLLSLAFTLICIVIAVFTWGLTFKKI